MGEGSGRPERLDVGSVFAGYRIDGLLDRGGMGVVYRATDLDLDRTVALKIIAPEHTQNETAVARFKTECRLAASLEHPNIVPIHRGGQFEGVLYLAMRYVPGTNLREVIDAGSLDLSRVARIMTQLGGALDAAHARGLVHRDVKPANILLSGKDDLEQVYLTDFGLTKRLGSAGSDLTRDGSWVGTPDYVAPEQIQGHVVDRRADVYSLGCVLYEMLTGHVAFRKDSDVAKLWAHVSDPPPLPRSERPELVRAFDDVVGRATAKDPGARYESAGSVAAAVREAVADQKAASAKPIVPVADATRDETFLEQPMAPAAAAPPPPPPRVAAAPVAEAAGPAAAQAPARRRARGGGSADAGGAGWLSRRRKSVGVIAALLAAAVIAVVLLSSGSSTNTAAEPSGQKISGRLGPVPTNRVTGRGTAVMHLDGRVLTAEVDTSGLLNGAAHMLHIHAGEKGVCPPASAARPHNGHRVIATHDGGPFYGGPVAALTTRGSTDPDTSLVAFSRYPTTGAIRYDRTIRVDSVTASYLKQNNAVVVVHGVDYNHNGAYDGTLDRSDLNPSLTGESTAPALCGPIVVAKTSSGKKNAQAGEIVLTASLHPTSAAPAPAPGLPPLICHLGAVTGGDVRSA